MSRKKTEERVRKCAAMLIEEKGYISPIDLYVRMEWLTMKQVEDWRFKRITYLERVTACSLTKLNHTLSALQTFAHEQKLKPSKTVYKSWGKGPKKQLRFSKTGNPHMEDRYATHYVRPKVNE